MIGVTAFTYYCWRKEFGGLKSDQVKRLKDLEKENERLHHVEPENFRHAEQSDLPLRGRAFHGVG